MAIFKTGHFDQVGLKSAGKAKVLKDGRHEPIGFPRLLTAASVPDLAVHLEPPPLDLAQSDKKWAVYLRKIKLLRNFEGFIADFLKPTNQLYFISIAWDYSGQPPFVYPPQKINPASVLIKMKPGNTRDFMGDGVGLWVPRKVIGALNVILLIYENDENIRKTGELLVDIRDTVRSSQLASLIVAISVNPALATGVAIGAAVNELMGVIGSIMKKNQDDYVDMFEGTWGTDKKQNPAILKYKNEGSQIEIEFRTS